MFLKKPWNVDLPSHGVPDLDIPVEPSADKDILILDISQATDCTGMCPSDQSFHMPQSSLAPMGPLGLKNILVAGHQNTLAVFLYNKINGSVLLMPKFLL